MAALGTGRGAGRAWDGDRRASLRTLALGLDFADAALALRVFSIVWACLDDRTGLGLDLQRHHAALGLGLASADLDGDSGGGKLGDRLLLLACGNRLDEFTGIVLDDRDAQPLAGASSTRAAAGVGRRPLVWPRRVTQW
ncbi:MAG: hypothetical protein HC857_07420 [Synechococcales cyanobacterium RU_4_20]|nr:hypothetical protein [Synechococcales cyanobacterium RU_4_20]